MKEIDESAGRTAEKIEYSLKEEGAKAQATMLEIIRDLPNADVALPENVLFVCNFNPVTNDDNLELIFSRFGEINNCEVIRNWKTGKSLHCAFFEFAKRESCEQACFKMDNVHIDYRRIHVDLSRSMATVEWKGKGRGVIGSWSESEKENKRKKRRSILDSANDRGARVAIVVIVNNVRLQEAEEEEVRRQKVGEGVPPQEPQKKSFIKESEEESLAEKPQKKSIAKRTERERKEISFKGQSPEKDVGKIAIEVSDTKRVTEVRSARYRSRSRDREPSHRKEGSSRERSRRATVSLIWIPPSRFFTALSLLSSCEKAL